MFTYFQTRSKLDDLVARRISFEHFEDWFRDETPDVQLWSEGPDRDLAFALEGVFSEYHFADLAEEQAIQDFFAAIRPFDEGAHAKRGPGSSEDVPVILHR